MILTTSDPVCIARDPASLEPEWSELARRRAYPTVFLTPDWIRLARRHDRRQQITLGIADRGIAALALDADGTISFAGGEFTDYRTSSRRRKTSRRSRARSRSGSRPSGRRVSVSSSCRKKREP